MYRPVIRQLGSGGRELGDGILLAGARAVVVQVKSRSLPEGELVKEANWIQKNGLKAFKQARGTVRSLRGAPATLVNLRGREVDIDGTRYKWLSVVVIDHPVCPDDVVVCNPFPDLPAVALTRRDWEFLFTQLRSTHAVVDYISRVADQSPVALGREPVRYYELAQADEDATPEDLAPEVVGKGKRYSAPLLPKAPAGAEDIHSHSLLRIILEDIATSPLPGNAAEADRVGVLAEIDQLPVQQRTELARALLVMLDEVAKAPEGHVMWRMRTFRFPPGKPQLIFMASNKLDESVRHGFSAFVMMRHHEFGESTGTTEELASVGVLLTPRSDGLRPWDTTMVRVSGMVEFEPGELEAIQELWSGSRIVGSPTRPRKKWTSKAKRSAKGKEKRSKRKR
ncbi:hypothetical protein [Micromonospora matsumotoense]|uniref:hypothetical protein n=1 Tax=Micromonospora matsumotoense TaxID=121616 RepID=UPI00114D3B37|nr:hypothetical protein [Micromonospora matsumotoense]